MGINVLSLFDGMSCARLALQDQGIAIDKYYSSEEVEARAYYYHIETDEEFEVRESQEREDQEKMYALKLKKEKELYEKLRQKFGN